MILKLLIKKVIVSNKKKYSVETINVKDTKKYLDDYLVKNYSQEFNNMKFVGITGTNITRNIDISLIDTAGEERFKSITKAYYKGSDGIILMFDTAEV